MFRRQAIYEYAILYIVCLSLLDNYNQEYMSRLRFSPQVYTFLKESLIEYSSDIPPKLLTA